MQVTLCATNGLGNIPQTNARLILRGALIAQDNTSQRPGSNIREPKYKIIEIQIKNEVGRRHAKEILKGNERLENISKVRSMKNTYIR